MSSFGTEVEGGFSQESSSTRKFLELSVSEKEEENSTRGRLPVEKKACDESECSIQLPRDILQKVVLMHIASSPTGVVVELRKVSAWIKNILSDAKLVHHHARKPSEPWLVHGLKKTPKGLHVTAYNVEMAREQAIPVPSFFEKRLADFRDVSLCSPKRSSGGSRAVDECKCALTCWTGGESGMIYSLGCHRRCTTWGREDFFCVYNPVTLSFRSLPLRCPSDRMVEVSVHKFSFGYMVWESQHNHGEQWCPLMLDLSSNSWQRMGDFVSRDRVRPEVPCVGGIVYMRYRSQEHKDTVLTYNIAQKEFLHVETIGLPDTVYHAFDQHLFQHAGDIYLVVSLTNNVPGALRISHVPLYKLVNTQWVQISVMDRESLGLLTGIYPAASELIFLVMEQKLLVVSKVLVRRMDHGRVVNDDSKPTYRGMVSYDFGLGTWEKDDVARLGEHFNSHTSVFTPRTDQEA